MTAAMFGMDLTTFAFGRTLSSLSMVMAAMREMTILPEVNCEISPSTCFASPAFTAIRMRSAFFAASRLSGVTATFPDRERGRVETFRFVMMTFVICGDFAIELATASPILPAPMTATINASTRFGFRVNNLPKRANHNSPRGGRGGELEQAQEPEEFRAVEHAVLPHRRGRCGRGDSNSRGPTGPGGIPGHVSDHQPLLVDDAVHVGLGDGRRNEAGHPIREPRQRGGQRVELQRPAAHRHLQRFQHDILPDLQVRDVALR